MKKKMLKAIGLLVMVCVMAAFLPAGTPPTVTFSSSYTDKDLSPFTSIYNHNGVVMSITEGKILADKIFAHCSLSGQYTLSSTMSTPEMLVYTKNSDETGLCMIGLTTGEVAFSAGMGDMEGEQDTPGLIKESDAALYCQNHLAALNLTPSGGMTQLDVTTFKMMALDDGVEKEYSKMITIMNGRKLLGIPVIGNSRVNMGLGTGGAMKFLMWNWMGVVATPIIPGDLLSASLIKDRIVQQLSTYFVDAKEVIVHENFLTYYDDGKSVIEPAYIMRIEIVAPDDSHQDADWVTSVMGSPMADYAHLSIPSTIPVDNGPPSSDTDDE